MLLAVAIAPVCIIFVLISDSLYAQVMPILSLIDVQNSQNTIFKKVLVVKITPPQVPTT